MFLFDAKARRATLGVAALALALGLTTLVQAELPMLGQPVDEADLADFNHIILPDGSNLPSGSGSAAQGAAIYAAQCAACHGAQGEGGAGVPALAGGIGSLATDSPLLTVGSYWPYATTLFDYVRRAMPPQAPRSLSSDELYQVSAYVLFLNGIISENAVLDANTLPQVPMPNRDGFIDRSHAF